LAFLSMSTHENGRRLKEIPVVEDGWHYFYLFLRSLKTFETSTDPETLTHDSTMLKQKTPSASM
jgi:hypothetical protein